MDGRAVPVGLRSLDLQHGLHPPLAWVENFEVAYRAKGAFNQGNRINYNKKVLTVAVGTRVVIYPPPYNGDRMWDGAKTRDASCTATTCHY